jgi:hypothetical protein
MRGKEIGWRWRVQPRIWRASVAVLVAAGFTLNAPNVSVAMAYDGWQAAQWADQHATDRSGMWTSFWDDCTNFVSEAVDRGGKYPEVGDMWHYAADDDHAWWFNYYNGQFYWSNSYTVAADLRTFEIWHYPGAYQWSSASAPSTGAYNSLQYGDMAWYDWGDDNGNPAGFSHVGIEVNYGDTDPQSGWNGDVVDAHTNDHYHAYWSMAPYNSRYQYESIEQMNIDSRN